MNGLGAGLVSVAIPVGLIWLKLGIAFTRMANRKSTSTKLALVGAFPLWALPFGLWLMMRPDALVAADEEEATDDMVDAPATEVPSEGDAVGPVSRAVGPVSN